MDAILVHIVCECFSISFAFPGHLADMLSRQEGIQCRCGRLNGPVPDRPRRQNSRVRIKGSVGRLVTLAMPRVGLAILTHHQVQLHGANLVHEVLRAVFLVSHQLICGNRTFN